MHQRLVPKPFKICMQNKDCLSRLTIGLRERLTNPRQWSPSLSSDHVTRQRGPNPVSRHLQLVLHHQPSLQFLQKTFKIHPIFSSKFPKMSSTPKPVIPAPLPVSNIDRNDRKECYRTHNSLGASLRKTLEEMTASGKLTAYAAEKILIHYDMQVAGALAAVTPRLSMKAESVQSYQVEGGGVHKFLFKNATVSVAGLQKRDELSVSNVPTVSRKNNFFKISKIFKMFQNFEFMLNLYIFLSSFDSSLTQGQAWFERRAA